MVDREKVLARYRAKKSYLLKKGLPEVEAVRQASGILDELGPKTAAEEFCEKPPQKPQKPQKPTRRLAADTADTADLPQTKGIHLYIQDVIKSLRLYKNAAQMLISAAIIIAATALLVSSSLEVLGYSWQGWAKCLLLELGIIVLFIFNAESKFQQFLMKATFVFLVVVSFFVLHTGVETSRDRAHDTASASDETLKGLRGERDRYQAAHDVLPVSYISKRYELLAKVSALNLDIRKTSDKLNQSFSVIDLNHTTEMMIRCVLLLLNLIFSHKLIETFNE